MKAFLIIIIMALSLASCSDSANINRSYVISKSQIDPTEEVTEEN